MTDKLPVEHIKAGNFLWYGGTTSMFGWNCPAKIVEVKNGEFTVMSLDDMKVQSQTYRVIKGDHEPESRLSMRAITVEEAREYMSKELADRTAALRRLEEKYQRESMEVEAVIAAIMAELP